MTSIRPASTLIAGQSKGLIVALDHDYVLCHLKLRCWLKGGGMGTVGLAEALAMLRDELSRAQEAGAGHQFRFEIAEAEVEFLVEVDAEGGGEAGGNIGVVALKAGGKVSRADSHRVRLKLMVKDAATGGRNLEVGRRESSGWQE